MKSILILIAILIFIAIASTIIFDWPHEGQTKTIFNNTEEDTNTTEQEAIEAVATNLHVPWSIAFLPNGDMLVTERSGTLRLYGSKEKSFPVQGVVERGEGGLHGVVLHPNYGTNKFIYLYFTAVKAGKTINRVARYIFDGNILTFEKMIIDDIPGGSNHNGGRIAFGPDGKLYITTGETGVESLAQNRESLAGKILRLNDDGSIPSDNPFGTAIYSWGHRNPQGIAWDAQGNLWETEHGRSGVRSGYDEVNLIEKGANYGWPDIEGDETKAGMKTPVLHSGSSMTWAPSGIIFKGDALFFAGLRGRALYEVPITGSGQLGTVIEHFKDEYGRLRAVATDKQGNLYISTSNQDGRGQPASDDDKVLKLSNF